jgi:hypothetical protein
MLQIFGVLADFSLLQRYLPQPQPGMGEYIKKPVGFSSFPKELTPTARKFAEKEANIVFYREHDKVCDTLNPASLIYNCPQFKF